MVVKFTDLSGTGRRAVPQRRVSGGREEGPWRFSAGHPEHGLHHRVPEEPLHGQRALLRGYGIPPAPPALRLPQGVPGSVQCVWSHTGFVIILRFLLLFVFCFFMLGPLPLSVCCFVLLLNDSSSNWVLERPFSTELKMRAFRFSHTFLTKVTSTHTQPYTNTHTHTHTHTLHARARAHTRTRTRTHTYVIHKMRQRQRKVGEAGEGGNSHSDALQTDEYNAVKIDF